MNDFNDEIKYTVIKFADSIKLERCTTTGEDSIKIQNVSRQIEETVINKITIHWRQVQYTAFMQKSSAAQIQGGIQLITEQWVRKYKIITMS